MDLITLNNRLNALALLKIKNNMLNNLKYVIPIK